MENFENQIHVLFGFDMENDVGSFTPFYKGVKEATPVIVDLYKRKNIKGTFFYTGDAAKQNPESVHTVLESGNEVGCHSLFHETVGTPLFHVPLEKSLLPEEVERRIELATEWVEEVSGIRPTSFRCPRLWGSTDVVNALEKLNYKVDATYPMYYFREQLAPYYPNKSDWTKEGDSTVLELPNFADLLMESKDGELQRDRDQWPLFRTLGAKVLMEKVDGFINLLKEKNKPIVLTFYFHPWEFIELEESYHFGECTITPDEFITKNCGPVALKEFESLIDALLRRGAVFHRMDEFAEVWNQHKKQKV